MYTCTQNRTLHDEDCPARSLYPWREMVEIKLFKFWNTQLFESESDYALLTQTELYFYQPIKRSSLTNLWFLTSFWRNQKHPIFLRIVICLQSKNRLKCFIKLIKLYFTSLKPHLHGRKFLARLGWKKYAYQKNWFGTDRFSRVNDFAPSVPSTGISEKVLRRTKWFFGWREG